jgi:hypothetical protein
VTSHTDHARAAVRRVHSPAAIRRISVMNCLYGIAGLLMKVALHHATRQGMTRLILEVLLSRIAAISFYRRLGYTKTWPT